MYTYMCFLYPLNILGRIYKELASVVGRLRKKGLTECWDERKASFKIF